MLEKKAKQRLINKFKVHDTDTGSPQVQIAILTEEINQLTDHLKMHKHDYSSRRGLLRKVGERRRLLKYLQREDEKAFMELATKLKLKIAKKMIEEEEERKALEEELMTEDMVEEGETEKNDKA
jgi:small subunit ribosomal protein S15